MCVCGGGSAPAAPQAESSSQKSNSHIHPRAPSVLPMCCCASGHQSHWWGDLGKTTPHPGPIGCYGADSGGDFTSSHGEATQAMECSVRSLTAATPIHLPSLCLYLPLHHRNGPLCCVLEEQQVGDPSSEQPAPKTDRTLVEDKRVLVQAQRSVGIALPSGHSEPRRDLKPQAHSQRNSTTWPCHRAQRSGVGT